MIDHGLHLAAAVHGLAAVRGGGVKCNRECARAILDLLRLLYRLVYAKWGFSGCMKLTGALIAGWSFVRMAILLSTPITPFRGRIRLVNQRFVIEGVRRDR